VTLRDQNRNYYNRIASRTQSEQVISPGRTITDMIEFEAPPRSLILELDLPIPGGDKSFQFQIPPIFVQQVSTVVGTPKMQEGVIPPTPTPTPTSTPPPYEPEQDQQLVGKVNVDYRDAVRKLEQRILGMSTNNALRFKKTATDKLLKSLATKYELKVEQIRRMIGSR